MLVVLKSRVDEVTVAVLVILPAPAVRRTKVMVALPPLAMLPRLTTVAPSAPIDEHFLAALAEMPDDVRCKWTDIRTLIPGDTRGRYEEMACAARGPIERRYWLLGRPRLSAAANEWRNEFYARRVQSWIASGRWRRR